MPAVLAAMLLGALPAGEPARAADEAAGKAKAVVCQACHGADGISPNDQWPNLAGQKRGYLVAQLKAFRGRKRIDESMQLITRPLTDADIENLAAYYSGLR
jgi:cytochrome c553